MIDIDFNRTFGSDCVIKVLCFPKGINLFSWQIVVAANLKFPSDLQLNMRRMTNDQKIITQDWEIFPNFKDIIKNCKMHYRSEREIFLASL